MSKNRADLAKMMPDSIPIFFSKRDPYSGQVAVMPEIVKGNNVLFAAPTASGKTEAAICPLYQRHISFKRDCLSVIYVAPTKALVNDLYERLTDYLVSPDVIARYTGDRHEFKSPDNVFCLIVTPEALDSLQLRRREDLTKVRAVVIDEIHLLHGQPRGQQLRHVIDRIAGAVKPPKSSKDNFQIIGMTATLENLPKVANLWLGPNSLSIEEGTPREIDLSLLKSNETIGLNDNSADIIANWIKLNKTKKVLIFGNSRNRCHELAAKLSKEFENTQWKVHLHFGALAAASRESIEDQMRSDRFGICVATSTLEIGIDIGNIDTIILADLPFQVSSFLQRIGRGNRRTGTCKVVGICKKLNDEKSFNAILDCARRGDLDDVYEYDRPSVRFQQVMSLAWFETQHDRALSLEKLETMANTREHGQVIDDMLAESHLKNIRNALVPSDEFIDIIGDGKIHTVIMGGASNEVYDHTTGEHALSDAEEITTGGAIYHEGRLRQLDAGQEGKLFLGKEMSNNQQLAELKRMNKAPPTSRCVIWANARQNNYDPTRWLYSESTLVTWGGKRLNELFSAVLMHTTEEKFKCSDTIIVGNFNEVNLSLDSIRNLAKQVKAANQLPKSLIKRFNNPGSHFKYLSEKLQESEQLRAVPWPNLFSWLEKITNIDQTSSIPVEII